MVSELLIAGLTTVAYRKIKNIKEHKEERNLISKWNAAMAGVAVKNEDDTFSTFEIVSINQKEYGFDCKVSIPFRKSFEDLEKQKQVIETNLNCLCEIEKYKFAPYANVKIINNPLNNLTYELVETKPYELFLGYKYDGTPYKLNMVEDSHLLIGGIRGSGKSRLQFIALTTLLHNHDESEIELYLMELLKKDLKKFKDLKQVKLFMDELVHCKIILEKIEKAIEKRAEKIDAMNSENIYEYNKIAKNKLKYIYIFADEYSLFMKDENDCEEETKYKEVIESVLKKIAKLGRSVGIFFISGLQRSTVTEINSLIKSQMCRCSFAQLSARDSENIIGTTDAHGLLAQECIVFTGHEYVHLKTPYIDNSIINSSLGIKVKEQILEEPQGKTVLRGGWHNPTPEEWKTIRDTIPLMNVPEKQEPAGQMQAPKRGKGHAIPLSEVNKSVNA
jgi:hypothetical protein